VDCNSRPFPISGGPNPRWARAALAPWASFLLLFPSRVVYYTESSGWFVYWGLGYCGVKSPTCRPREALEEGVAWLVACPVAGLGTSNSQPRMPRPVALIESTYTVVRDAVWYTIVYTCKENVFQEYQVILGTSIANLQYQHEEEASSAAFFWCRMNGCGPSILCRHLVLAFN
jgi:hypothetical protein